MLSCEIPSPAVFFDALSAVHNLQQHQYHEQLMHQKPKIIKKIEAEDFYQIQIFKQNGNFNSYEMKVLRNFGNPNLVNLVVESQRDGFRKIFTFQKNEIQIQEIDWQYFRNDNLLVLNVPKKPKFCPDDFIAMLSNVLNLANPHKPLECRRSGTPETDEEEFSRQAVYKKVVERELEQQKEVEKQMKLKRASERLAAIQREKEQQAAVEQEARRKAILEKQAIIEAERRKRVAAVRNRKREEESIRKAKEEKENRESIEAAQKYLSALLGGALFSQFGNRAMDYGKSEDSSNRQMNSGETESFIQHIDGSPNSSEISTPETLPSVQQDNERELIEFDLESIHSDSSDHTESLQTAPDSKDNALKRHPSMEEVEDEEFVVFRKKFGK